MMPDSVFSAVLTIAQMIRDKGGRALLVGGCVRDFLLGKECKDYDLEVYGLTPDEIRNTVSGKFELDSVGASFGVFKVHHFDIDIALPRKENKTGAGHKGFMVQTVPDLSFAEAAARRDFTLNAIMRDPLTGEILDPWNGQQDLKDGILRHVSEHFSEDPLRVLRAMQFIARFGFTPAEETVRICADIRQDELPSERLAGEWEKLLLKGVGISKGLQFLADCGWSRYYPELKKELCPALDRIPEYRTGNAKEDLLLPLAVLCHGFTQEEVRSFLSRIWNRNELLKQVPLLISCIGELEKVRTDEQLRRLALKAGNLKRLGRIEECLSGKNPCREQNLRRAEEMNIAEQPPVPLILGRHLMERGISPGPDMGRLLAACFEAQLRGEFQTLEEGLARL